MSDTTPRLDRDPLPRFGDLLPSARATLPRFMMAGLLPIVTFYVLFRLGGASLGIGGGMVVSLTALAIQLRRLGRLDPVVLVPMLLIVIQGTAALMLDSIEVYLAVPVAENLIWGIVLVGSALLRRPLVRVIARELGLIPTAYDRSATVGRALSHVTLAWGLLAFVKAAARVWLLIVLPLEAFLVAVTVFNLTLNGLMLAYSFWWPLRAVRLAGAT